MLNSNGCNLAGSGEKFTIVSNQFTSSSKTPPKWIRQTPEMMGLSVAIDQRGTVRFGLFPIEHSNSKMLHGRNGRSFHDGFSAMARSAIAVRVGGRCCWNDAVVELRSSSWATVTMTTALVEIENRFVHHVHF
jgi:hypothetical protein